MSTLPDSSFSSYFFFSPFSPSLPPFFLLEELETDACSSNLLLFVLFFFFSRFPSLSFSGLPTRPFHVGARRSAPSEEGSWFSRSREAPSLDPGAGVGLPLLLLLSC